MRGTAYVNRFRQSVSLTLPGKGDTVYLSAWEAKLLAAALIQASVDIDEIPDFTKSKLGVIQLTLELD